MAANPPGWESLYRTVQPSLKNKKDLVVLFVHWNFVRNDIRCLGTGNALEFDSSEEGSELLPDKWNESETYFLRYIHGGELYLFSVQFIDTRAVFNVLKASDRDIVSLVMDYEEDVSKIDGKLIEMMPNYEELSHKVKVNLMEGIKNKKTTNNATQTEKEKTPPQRVQLETVIPPQSRFPPNPRHDPLLVNPFGYGNEDLYPGGFGGGAIFNPPGLSGINPRLPFPRYDPIGPSGLDSRFRNPRPDHFKPPGFDDMYM